MTDRNLLLLVLTWLIISVMLLTNVAIAESTDGETDVYYEKNTSSPSVHLLNAPSSVYGSDELDVTVGWSNIPTDWELIVSLEKSEANKDRLADDVNRTISGSGEATFKLNVYPVNETYNQTRIWACLIDDNKEWANVFTDIGIIVLPALPPQPTATTPSIHILNSPSSVNGSTELDVTVGWNNIPADWELIVSLEKSGTDKNRLADDANRIVSGSGEATFKLNVYPVNETYNQARICAYLLDDDREWANVFTDIGIIVIPALPPQPQPTTFILPEYMLAAALFLAVLILIKFRKKTITMPSSIKSVPPVPPVLPEHTSTESTPDMEPVSDPEQTQTSHQPVPNFIKEPESIDIKRGYEVLSNNDLRFGIRIVNSTDYAIMDVEILLDYDKTLFSLNSNRLVNLANIHPHGERTATYMLTPLGCVHNETIGATIIHKNHTGKKHTMQMRSKKVHCVCPFLKGKAMSEGDYSRLTVNSDSVQEGISFKGITIEELSQLITASCRHMLYKVKEYDLENKKVIYLSGESIGEKAYYLLTTIIQDYKGLTQVVLIAYSNKKYGLNGFINEKTENIRHLVESVQSAKEIGIIENKQVINIIDSIVQRTKFEIGAGDNNLNINIDKSLVQRSKIEHDNKHTKRETTEMEYSKVYEHLIDIAKKGCKIQNTELDLHNQKERLKLCEHEILIKYGDLAKKYNSNNMPKLFGILDKINEETKKYDEPILLSALVVNKNKLHPSNPFFKKWLPGSKDEDELSDWVKELEKVWKYYCK